MKLANSSKNTYIHSSSNIYYYKINHNLHLEYSTIHINLSL